MNRRTVPDAAQSKKPLPHLPPSAPRDTVAGAPILIYKTLISFLVAACSSNGTNRREIVQRQQILNAHVLAMTSNDVVGVVVNSLQCRRTLLELAAEFGLREDPNLRHSLRADEAELVSHVVKILDSKAQETVVLSLVGNAAQSFIDVVQDILDRGSVLERTQGKKARRIIRKLSEACDKLPSALFVTGVSGCPTHPTFGGGFGDVYCASHGGKAVALKVMRHFSESAESRNIRLNICREALVWRGLHHPHILPFIGIDRDTFPSLAIVSPWMEQGTVLNHLDRHGRADVDKLLFQIAQGIGYLHSRNIVHGDLRGANILVNDNWTACLADFGLSNFTDPISTASSTKRAGSLYWMAPELLDPNRYGRKFVRTPATDVYAFGCVCVELYTGRPPLSDLPGPAVIFPILNGERAPRPMGPPTMSDTLWQNVTNYWAADPEARPSSDIMTQQMVWPALGGEDRLDPEARPSSDVMTQQMVWPGEDRLVAVGVATPPLEIASQREPLPVEPTVAAGHPEEDANGTRSIEVEESEVLTSEARIPRPNENETKQTFPMAGSSAESRETALIKEKNPGELQISRFEHPHNEVWLMDKGKRKSALQSLIHLVKKPILTQGLKRAIEDGSPTETLLSFVEKGADVNVQAKGSPVYFDSPWRPSTALQVAAYRSELGFMRAFIHRNADIEARNQDGVTTLWIAAERGQLDVVKFLLDNNANIEAASWNKYTSLVIASQRGHIDVVKFLLEKNANIEASGRGGANCLLMASSAGHAKVVKLLLDQNANTEARWEGVGISPHGTSLIIASKYGHLDVVRLLLEKNVNIEATTPSNSTSLFLASMYGHVGVVQLLLDHGANIDARSLRNGGTALINASEYGKLEIVKLLLDNGANIEASTPGGATSLWFACDYGHIDIVKILLEKNANIEASAGGITCRAAALRSRPSPYPDFAGRARGLWTYRGEIVGLLEERARQLNIVLS